MATWSNAPPEAMKAFNAMAAYSQGLATGCKALKKVQMCAMCAAKPALHKCGKCLAVNYCGGASTPD